MARGSNLISDAVPASSWDFLYRGIAYILSASSLANIAYFAYLVKFYAKRRCIVNTKTWLATACSYHMYWSCGPLLVPYLSIMLNFITCERYHQCSLYSVSEAEMVYFILNVMAHATLSLIYTASVFEWSPLESNLSVMLQPDREYPGWPKYAKSFQWHSFLYFQSLLGSVSLSSAIT
jgi:hypothetical protein